MLVVNILVDVHDGVLLSACVCMQLCMCDRILYGILQTENGNFTNYHLGTVGEDELITFRDQKVQVTVRSIAHFRQRHIDQQFTV